MRKTEYVKDKIRNLKNAFVRFKECDIKKIKNSEFKNALDRNDRFKNIHSGERCFIIGSGPSLKSQDLSLLKDEFVICVNQCSRNSQFNDMKPNYYVCVDQNFFRIDENNPEDTELLSVFEKLTSVEGMHCFFPIQQKESFIKRFNLDERIDVNYIISGEVFTETYSRDIDLTGMIPTFGTVVQTAVLLAVYMGFKEIYLLGCDNTSIIVTLNSVLKKNNDEFYSYDVSDNENKRMENMVERTGVERYASAYYSAVRDYRRLYSYCKKKEISLVNCSAETAIDSIPREDYLSVLNKK